MKKVTLLVLVVLVLSTVLMAAIPTKMVRLTIINKSDPETGPGDFAVYMKLTGSAVTNSFYYLTVPAGSRDAPTVKVFTIMQDVYDRETWACNGVRSTGNLVVASNLRLTFTQCGQVKLYCAYYDVNDVFLGKDICGRFVPVNADHLRTTRTWRPSGEPTMEKVTYFRILRWTNGQFPQDLVKNWNLFYLVGGWWTTGCTTFFWRSYTWKTPVGCNWYYQY